MSFYKNIDVSATPSRNATPRRMRRQEECDAKKNATPSRNATPKQKCDGMECQYPPNKLSSRS